MLVAPLAIGGFRNVRTPLLRVEDRLLSGEPCS